MTASAAGGGATPPVDAGPSPNEPPVLVFVSGASSGIGRALVETLPFPARCIGISRRASPGIEHLGADLAELAGWKKVIAAFDRMLPAFQGERVVFVHAAGTLTPIGFAGEGDAEAYRRQVLLNAACPQVLGDAFLRARARCRAGRADLVQITSGAATRVYEGWSAYGAGKAAVDQWVRTAGAEQARRGSRTRVLAVAPGVVATAMQDEIRATPARDFPHVDRFVELHERGELRDPHDAARDIWSLLERELDNGAVLDLRELAAKR